MQGLAYPRTKPETVAANETEKKAAPTIANVPVTNETKKPAVKDAQALAKVREIAELHKIGALTDEEFEEKKKNCWQKCDPQKEGEWKMKKICALLLLIGLLFALSGCQGSKDYSS